MTIIFDGEIPGFGVRCTSGGAISYFLDYRVKADDPQGNPNPNAGEQQRITIGRYIKGQGAAGTSPEAARIAALKLREDVRKGNDPLAEKKKKLHQPKMAELRESYLKDYAEKHKRPGSVRNDRSILDNIIVPNLGDRRVADITKRDIEKLRDSLAGTPYHANHTLALLSKMFSLAVEWKLRADNPVRGAKRFAEEKRERWLSAKELKDLFKVLDGYEDKEAANALRLIAFTGARKGEVLAAKWEQFDLINGRWIKPSSHTKQKQKHAAPLSAAALKLLKKMRQTADPNEPHLFPGRFPGKPLENLKQHWPKIRKAAGLPDVRVHDLRHTFASHLVSSGVSLPTVGALLGHASPLTTQRYAHLSDESMRAAANLFPAKGGGK